MSTVSTLTPDGAEAFADIALANVGREFPNKLDHVMGSSGDVRQPRELHPAFYGSFDWHSCVHMHWLLARVRRIFPDLPQRSIIASVLDEHLADANIAGECRYLARPDSRSFERTYGWAWLLELASELRRGTDPASRRWAVALQPLAEVFVERYLDYLPRQHYPLRAGVHPNSAFGLMFALDHARVVGQPTLEALCVERARTWFGADRDAPVVWEPSGTDFFSPALIEAALMRRVLPQSEFSIWLEGFLPGLARCEPAALFVPAIVTDRKDPFIVHLDGLNLSRAWCFAGIASALASSDPRIAILREAGVVHLEAGLSGMAGGDYMGEHWLATFATLALTQ
ncbi:MAG: DUF2891 domain-containing protein [Betaproteobacteria bacterium]